MKRSVRTLLFFIFVFLFLVTVPIIIAYSQGYRVDRANRTLVQTGALALEPRPAPVEILLDGVMTKRSNFVFQNIFIGDLIPRAYQIQVRKEGYHSWQKSLLVAPKLVTEVKNILLFPASLTAQEVAADVGTFFLSPTHRGVAVIRESNNQQIDIIPQGTDGTTSILRISQDFSGFRITRTEWSKDATRLLLLIESGQIKKWLLVDMRKVSPSILDLSLLLNAQVAHPSWSPDNSSEIFFVSRNTRTPNSSSLFSYNIEKEELSQPLADDILFYTVRENRVLYISSRLLSLNSIDLASGEIQQVSYNPLFGIERDPTAIFLNLPRIAVHANSAVYLFDSDTSYFQKIADKVDEATLSPDKKKLLLRNKNTLRIYWLADVRIQPFRDKGDSEEIWRGTSPIHDAVWVGENSAHVVFAGDAGIQVVELDGRDKRNIHTLLELPSSQLVYVQKDDTLYFLSENTLYLLQIK